jgi:hypothetical protein
MSDRRKAIEVGSNMESGRIFLLMLLVLALMSSATISDVSAQGGNAGGTIGKERKMLSGEQSGPPPARQPLTRPRREGGSAASTAPRSLTGTWNWSGQCAKYKEPYVGTVTFKQTGSTFTGTHGGTNMWDKGTISNGRISGNHVSFQRTFGQYTDNLSLTLSSNGKRMSGIIPDTEHSGRCAMTFSRL